MINYSDEGWQLSNWNNGLIELREYMPGKFIDGFPSI